MSPAGRSLPNLPVFRPVILLCASMVAACGLVDSGDDGPDELVMPGILGVLPSATIRSRGPAEAGTEFRIVVATRALPGCGTAYDVTGPHETRVVVDGPSVEIHPFDLVRRVPTTDGRLACPDALPAIYHEANVVPPTAGVLTVRVFGRLLEVGERANERGEAVVHAMSFDVRP